MAGLVDTDWGWEAFEELVNLSPTPLPKTHFPGTPPITPSSQGKADSGELLHNGLICDVDGEPSFGDVGTNHDHGEDNQDDSEPRREYELRPQARELKSGFTTTWIDDDNTDDYDPSEERRQQYLRRKAAKIRPQRSHAPVTQSSLETGVSREGPVVFDDSLIVTVRFGSESGRTGLRDLVANLADPSEYTEGSGYAFRKRKHETAFTYTDSYDATKARSAQNLLGDPTGHPFARGCWECASLGHECSLLADEASWPCTTCLEDGHECELVTAPTIKRACERCKSRRSACSYSYTLNHGVACQQCMDSGQKCVAGPAKDAVRMRIRYDRKSVHEPILPNSRDRKTTKVRNHDACVECQTASRPCTFETDGNCGKPCAACLGSGAACTMKHLMPMQQALPPRPTLNVAKRAEKPDRSNPMPAQQKDKHTQSSATIKVITTKLCHPIVFNHEDSTARRRPCHFCADASYGIFGLGDKRVEVRESPDGRGGWEEVKGGHRADGVERSRMCPTCCLSRLSIIVCERHELQPMTGVRPTASDNDAAVVELLSGNPRRQEKWCAICPSLASFQCCAASDQPSGCGLMLCEQCAGILSRVHNGDLQSMLPTITDAPSQERPLGLRADYGLLKHDGLLMSFMLTTNT